MPEAAFVRVRFTIASANRCELEAALLAATAARLPRLVQLTDFRLHALHVAARIWKIKLRQALASSHVPTMRRVVNQTLLIVNSSLVGITTRAYPYRAGNKSFPMNFLRSFNIVFTIIEKWKKKSTRFFILRESNELTRFAIKNKRFIVPLRTPKKERIDKGGWN